jgi:hypothetical protein
MAYVYNHVIKEYERCIYKASVIVLSFEEKSFLTSLETR